MSPEKPGGLRGGGRRAHQTELGSCLLEGRAKGVRHMDRRRLVGMVLLALLVPGGIPLAITGLVGRRLWGKGTA